MLESMRGLDETIQYGYGEKREKQMEERSVFLGNMQKELSRMEGGQRDVINLVILLCSFGMLFLMLALYARGAASFDGVVICTVAQMGSFGPVVALSSLSNNLNQTLASGERVLSILEEIPMVEEVPMNSEELNDVDGKMNYAAVSEERSGSDDIRMISEENTMSDDIQEPENDAGKHRASMEFAGASAQHVTFAYEDEVILKDYSIHLNPGKIIGIHGASGSGKSTLLKLLMRFWDVNQGTIEVNGAEIRQIPTRTLRDMESYVTQETHLLHDSIANNIAIGKPGASREEIVEVAKKASIHDFIQTLPDGYDTKVGELSEEYAAKTIKEIYGKFENLQMFPGLGSDLSKRVSFRTDYKYAIWKDYAIIYKVGKEYVEIYRVMNRYQDITRIFE